MMQNNKLLIRNSLNKAFGKVKPDRESFEAFKVHLARLLDLCDSKKDEEFNKNLLSDFLKKSFYGDRYFINTKENSDLVIHNDKGVESTAGVIFETKKPTKTASVEMPKVSNLNTKAVQQLVLYFLRERVTHGNLQVKHLVVTNIYEWFIFDAELFDRLFYQDKSLVKQFKAFEEKQFSSNKTDVFYKEIAKPAIALVIDQIKFTHFDLRDLENLDLIELYKIFSPEHLLKIRSANDSNSLNKPFYNELLYIIGLTEFKDKGKKLIDRMKEGDRQDASLIENAIAQIIELDKISRDDTQQLFDVALDLAITWVNRILFLKLLEAQLIKYHQGDQDEQDFAFLNSVKIKDYGDLNKLFFSVLALEHGDRAASVKEIFANVPYLNSSLFELTATERDYIAIRSLGSNESLAIFGATVLTDGNDKKRSGKLNALEYLFEFLHAYKFNKDEFEDGQEDSEKLVNASVLGLIFEKINGYKDGSFYTPSFITMYVCRETIRRAVVQKFNEEKGWSCENIQDLCEDLGRYIKGTDRVVRRNKANRIVNSLKICDPAVGSRHFLVSALNEMIAIKQYLGILQDRNGESLSKYEIEVINDKLKMTLDGKLFAYNPKNKESQRVQEALFHEKQTIIESCLFGVDINQNSVKICQLRLWIELLKNAYYRTDGNLETLPNIDINIKCGNSLISRFPIDSDLKSVLFARKNQSDIVNYKNAVRKYFKAKNKQDKKDNWNDIQNIKKKMKDSLQEISPKQFTLKRLESELSKLEDLQRPPSLDIQLEALDAKAKKLEKEREKKINKLNNEIDKLSAEIEDIESGRLYENALEWRFEFPEVLNDDGDFVGFDVVIGNPPYISIQDLNKTEKISTDYYRINFESAQYGNFDIYILFMERINALTSSCSTSSFILPSKFLTTDYGKPIRQYLLKNKLISYIIDFEHHQVFDTATIYTCIVFFNKDEKDSLYFYKTEPSKILDKEDVENNILYSDLFDKTWIFDENTSIEVVKKINSNSIKLKDLPCDISRGSSTGNDKIFILTRKNDGFINGYGEYVEIEQDLLIKPIFATNFNRYIFKDDIDTYLIFPYVFKNQAYSLIDEETFKNKYPKTYQYLLNQKVKLQERKQIKDWYAFSAARSLINHATSDILIPLLADKGIFTLTPKDFKYTLMAGGGFSISIKNKSIDKKFLLCLLNSKLLFFVLYRESNKFRGGYITCTKQYFENLPIKLINPSAQEKFVKLVDEILAAKKGDRNADTSELEKAIDDLVYQLYGLTEEEIKIVEGANDRK